MKRLFNGMCVMVVLLVVVMIIGQTSSLYTLKDCKVIESTTQGITIKDAKDDIWIVNGVYYPIGTTVKMKMHTNYSDNNNTDDIVREVIEVK